MRRYAACHRSVVEVGDEERTSLLHLLLGQRVEAGATFGLTVEQLAVELLEHRADVGVVELAAHHHQLRELLAHLEGIGRRAEALDEVEPGLGVVDGGCGAGRHPPHGSERAGLEPLGAATEEVAVHAAIDELAQGRAGLPDGEVDDGERVGEGADGRRVAILRLQPPDEAGRCLAQRVDRGQPVGEPCRGRVVHRLAERGDVELRKVELHGVNLSWRARSTSTSSPASWGPLFEARQLGALITPLLSTTSVLPGSDAPLR